MSSSLKTDESQYSWFRRNFWPIYGSEENKKFIPLLLMMMIGLFNYTCLRINKDAFVLGAPYAGKDTLSFLKLYLVIPMTFLFVILFWWASNKLSKEKLFFVTLAPFFIFFSLFIFVLMPYNEYLHASAETIGRWVQMYPRLAQACPVVGCWTYSLFYVVAELWGNVVITFLFWGFVNEIVRKDQTKRFYSLFASYGNFGLIIAGKFSSYVSSKELLYKAGSAERLAIMSWVFYIMLFCILLFALIYWHLNKNVLPYETVGSVSESMKRKPKTQVSISESFKTIISSRYLLCIFILVLAYGLAANLVEVSWKGSVKEFYGDNYKVYMSGFFEYTGWVVLIFGFLSKSWISRFGWLFAAIVTPFMMLVTSSLFFSYILFGAFLPEWMFFGYSPLEMSIFIGTFQNIGSKATKYTLFDPTTQMAYLPLDEDKRLKGKAAVDVIGGRMGKAGGAVIQSSLSMVYGEAAKKVITTAHILFPMVLILCVSWVFSTIGLAAQYNALVRRREEEDDMVLKAGVKSKARKV